MKRVFLAALGVVGVAIWGFSGRGNLGFRDEWTIKPWSHAWPFGAWGLPLVVLFLFGGAALLSVYDRFKRAKSRKEQKNSLVTALICLGILGFLWPWTLLGPGDLAGASTPAKGARIKFEGRFNLLAAQWSDVSTEYFGTAYTISDAREFSRTYAQRRQNPTSRALAHVATHPPGATLWFYGARRFVEEVPGLNDGLNSLASQLTRTDEATLFSLLNTARTTASQHVSAPEPAPLPRSAIGVALFCAMLMGLSLVLALPAVYGLATTGGEEESVDAREMRGLFACALWMLAPCVNLFAFSLDAVVAGWAAWTLYFAAKAITTGNRRFALATGLALALTTMLSFGALALGLVILLAAIFARTPRLVLLKALGLAGGAFVFSWAVAGVWGGFNPLQVMFKATAAHHFATLSVRSYWPWVVLNGVVWAIFSGLPLVISLQEAARTRKELIIRSGSRKEARALSTGMAFALGTILTLVLLCLLGQVRGEVERLWLFLLAPLAASVLIQNRKSATFMVILQAIQTLVMAATIAPLVRPF